MAENRRVTDWTSELMQADYQKTVLESGIRIVTERIPYVRSVSIGAWLITGSRDEQAQNNGISHFIEHMLFKGTEHRSAAEIAQSLESVGGQLNAFTGKEQTCYYAHVLDEHLPLAVDVLADILKNSVFDPTEMEKEKRVILEELNAIEETPEELIHELFVQDLFPAHPLGFSIIGKRENIGAFRREDIFGYLNENYSANRLVVAAAGNVDHQQLVKLVEKHFDRFGAVSEHRYVPPTAPVAGKNVVEDGALQAHVCVGTQSYSYRNEKKFGLLVLNTLLGAGMSSRLFQNVREKYGLAYSVYSFLDYLWDTGIFGIYVGTDREKIDNTVELVTKELDHLRREPVSEDELERTKSQLKGNLMLGLESTASRMNRLAKMEIYLEEYFTLDDTIREIEQVTSQDIMEIANELFVPERLYVTILTPRNDKK